MRPVRRLVRCGCCGVLVTSLAAAEATACSPASDLDGDGVVDVDDLLAVIAMWGTAGSPADFDADGSVDVDDLVALLNCWGTEFPAESVVRVGTSVAEHSPWGAVAFNDVMKQSWGQWWTTNEQMGGPFNTGYAELMTGGTDWPVVEIPWDPDGDGPIPPQVLHTVMMKDLYWLYPPGPMSPVATRDAERYPSGDYLVTFAGTGTIEMYGSDTGTQTYSGPGPHAFHVTNPNNSGIGVKIIASSAGDPVRDIQVRMPGYSFDDDENPQGPFTTEFVETIATHGVARFMGWAQANGHACYNGADPREPACAQDWAGRATPDQRTQTTSRGVALEYMIELANRAEVDPWFVIPHAATDGYLEQMALLVAERIDPERTVYLEYSNEVWNPIYDAYHYALAMGEGLADFAVPAWNVRRSQEIFCTFKEVGGFDDERLVTILSSQFNNPWLGGVLLGYWNDPLVNPNPCDVQLDRLGIGPYFADDDEHAAEPDDTMDEVIEKVLASIHEGRFHTRSIEYQAIADRWGVELVAYEGGHHLVEPDSSSPVQALFSELTRDRRIKDIYFAAFTEWSANTNGAMYTFASTVERYSPTSFFGHKEYAAQQLYVLDPDGLRPYKMEAVHEIALGLAQTAGP